MLRGWAWQLAGIWDLGFGGGRRRGFYLGPGSSEGEGYLWSENSWWGPLPPCHPDGGREVEGAGRWGEGRSGGREDPENNLTLFDCLLQAKSSLLLGL